MLSREFHTSLYHITPFEEQVLFDCLGTCYAWQYLNDPKLSGHLDAEEYYELCKRAGLSEEAAQKAGRERGLLRLRKDLPA